MNINNWTQKINWKSWTVIFSSVLPYWSTLPFKLVIYLSFCVAIPVNMTIHARYIAYFCVAVLVNQTIQVSYIALLWVAVLVNTMGQAGYVAHLCVAVLVNTTGWTSFTVCCYLLRCLCVRPFNRELLIIVSVLPFVSVAGSATSTSRLGRWSLIFFK